MEAVFNADGLYSYIVDGQNLIVPGYAPEYSDYRYIENEENGGKDTSNGVGEKKVMYEVSPDGLSVQCIVNAQGSKVPYTFIYTFYADGTSELETIFRPVINNLRRLGVELRFPREWQNVEYYARGPFSNYIDRYEGAFLGRYSTTVSDMYESFARPQSTGNHEALRWLTLTDENGKGVRIETEGQVSFSLLPYSDISLYNAKHNWELPPPGDVYAHFDYIQRGVGNGSCGKNTGTLTAYKVPDTGSYGYKLRIPPFNNKKIGIVPRKTTSYIK